MHGGSDSASHEDLDNRGSQTKIRESPFSVETNDTNIVITQDDAPRKLKESNVPPPATNVTPDSLPFADHRDDKAQPSPSEAVEGVSQGLLLSEEEHLPLQKEKDGLP